MCGPQPLDRDVEYTQEASTSHQLPPTDARTEEVEDAIKDASRHGSSLGSALYPEEAENNSKQSKSKFTSLPHITDLSTYMIQNVISFAKLIQTFRYY